MSRFKLLWTRLTFLSVWNWKNKTDWYTLFLAWEQWTHTTIAGGGYFDKCQQSWYWHSNCWESICDKRVNLHWQISFSRVSQVSNLIEVKSESDRCKFLRYLLPELGGFNSNKTKRSQWSRVDFLICGERCDKRLTLRAPGNEVHEYLLTFAVSQSHRHKVSSRPIRNIFTKFLDSQLEWSIEVACFFLRTKLATVLAKLQRV